MSAPVVHFDIAGPDEAVLHAFYGRTLGWEIAPKGPGYALVDPGAAPRGAIVEADAASVTIAFAVQDLDGVLAQALANGGTVVMPATDNGWVTKAQITDPAGNLVTLIQS
jgi:predicted enzyme related to lactoylglutathione lyase